VRKRLNNFHAVTGGASDSPAPTAQVGMYSKFRSEMGTFQVLGLAGLLASPAVVEGLLVVESVSWGGSSRRQRFFAASAT
jgi:hypothetical protein